MSLALKDESLALEIKSLITRLPNTANWQETAADSKLSLITAVFCHNQFVTTDSKAKYHIAGKFTSES